MNNHVLDVELSFRVETENPEKIDWVLESIFCMLTGEERIKKVGLNVR